MHVHSLWCRFQSLRFIKPSVKILYTLHDYHLICPTSNVFVKDKNCFVCSEAGKFSIVKTTVEIISSALVYFRENKTVEEP